MMVMTPSQRHRLAPNLNLRHMIEVWVQVGGWKDANWGGVKVHLLQGTGWGTVTRSQPPCCL